MQKKKARNVSKKIICDPFFHGQYPAIEKSKNYFVAFIVSAAKLMLKNLKAIKIPFEDFAQFICVRLTNIIIHKWGCSTFMDNTISKWYFILH